MLCRAASCQHREAPTLLTGWNSVVRQREDTVFFPDLPWFTCDMAPEFKHAKRAVVSGVRTPVAKVWHGRVMDSLRAGEGHSRDSESSTIVMRAESGPYPSKRINYKFMNHRC